MILLMISLIIIIKESFLNLSTWKYKVKKKHTLFGCSLELWNFKFYFFKDLIVFLLRVIDFSITVLLKTKQVQCVLLVIGPY